MRSICAALLGVFVLSGCNSGSGTPAAGTAANTAAAPAVAPPASKLGATGTQAMMATVAKYYGLKNALVASKAARADSAATALTASATELQATLQKDSVNMPVLKVYVDSIVNYSKAVNGIQDETCERQRILFDVISRNMYAVLKQTDLKNGHVYQEYCPMAFNEKGAHWLSGESEILNPYFGKKMLECGEVTDSL